MVLVFLTSDRKQRWPVEPSLRIGWTITVCLFTYCNIIPLAGAAEPVAANDLAAKLQRIDSDVLTDQTSEALSDMIRNHVQARLQAANRRSTAAWREIKTREDWEQFRDARIARLRASLGPLPARSRPLRVHTSATIQGDGYLIDNLVFESRPGVWATANLYLPAKRPKSMPGILICHSHHRPKEQGELQDMGMTWARHGCAVLVMDQLGHGERGEHGFATERDYAGPFRVSRQDYYFRYDVGVQLHLVGESLMGQMAGDLMRGVDMLLEAPNIDPRRIVLLGAVAGGGDVAAVTAALDERIDAVVPFNFGGPQGFTRYPLPDDAEETFQYAGSGGWESTRNLRLSAAEGFLPWAIVAAAAPRQLIYAHEFRWDRPRDPVWKRLGRVYALYDAADRLDFAHGRGSVKLRPPAATHCTNIGAVHRKMMHPVLNRWLGTSVTPKTEYSNRLPPERLRCMTGELRRQLKPKPLHARLAERVSRSLSKARGARNNISPAARREKLLDDWGHWLGDITPGKVSVVKAAKRKADGLERVSVEEVVLRVDGTILLPVVLLKPQAAGEQQPVVVAIAQGGKTGFFHHRTEELATLVNGGAAVALIDVRGCGETRSGTARGRRSADTSVSSSELMLGGTLLGARLRDLRSLIQYLRSRDDIDGGRLAIWGDSFAPANEPDTNFRVPRGIDARPRQPEPLGALLALLAAATEPKLRAAYGYGGLDGFASVLESPQVLIPHDLVVPGVLAAGELCDLAAASAPRPVRLEGLVDGLNRRLTLDAASAAYQPAIQSYEQAKARGAISFSVERESPAAWLLSQLRDRRK